MLRVYCRIRSSAQRVECMFKKNSIQTNHLAVELKPVIMRRKKKCDKKQMREHSFYFRVNFAGGQHFQKISKDTIVILPSSLSQ